ncbi:MAG TPA: type II toxin-antitoxin system Y4mF family antitoxin [Arthrobacter sp.]|nr:type II toxin-antitoxin system Y4mF family antitoxin [Arthrobacter sp.]
MESFTEALARQVRERRTLLQLSQIDVADLAGVSERFVRFIEHGKSSLQLDSLVAVLDVLGLELKLERRSNDQTGGRA